MVKTTLLLAAQLLIATNVFAAAGRVVVLQGTAAVTRAQSTMEDLNLGDAIEEGDTVEAGRGSYVRLLMDDESVLDLGERTRVVIRAYSGRPAGRKVSIRLWVGRLWARVMTAVGGADSYEIEGGNAVAGIRGTELVLTVDGDGNTELNVLHGLVRFASLLSEETVDVAGGEWARAGNDGNLIRGMADSNGEYQGHARPQPGPDFDRRGMDERLRSVRDRLHQEDESHPDTLQSPTGRRDRLLHTPIDDAEDTSEDPAHPFVDLDPEVGSGDMDATTRVRGRVEVVRP